ncbi:uncharacterized protein LOC144103318 [Amblyomma americanum]
MAEDLHSTLGSGRQVSRASVLRSKELQSAGAFIGCACGVSLVAATAALVWLTGNWAAKRDNASHTETPFCCPKEAARLFAVIDSSQEPCTDFFAYICKNAIEHDFVQHDVVSDMVWDVTTSIIKGTQNYSSKAAEALHALYTTCIEEIWQYERRSRGAVASMLEIANVTERMSGADLLRLVLAAYQRYHLTVIFEIMATGIQLTFVRRTMQTVHYKAFCDASCYAVSLSTLNEHFHTNYTAEDIAKWGEKFPLAKWRHSHTSMAEICEAFGHMKTSQFKEIFLENFIDLDHFKRFAVVSKANLLNDIQLLIDARNQPLSVFYVVLLLALDAMRYIQQDGPLNSPTMRSEDVCYKHMYDSAQLWRVTYVAALATPTKDRQLRNIFEATRQALADYAPLRRLVAAGNDTELFMAMVSNFSLLLPGELIFREPAVPHMSRRGFVRNLFMALNFEFDSSNEKARQGVPWFRDDAQTRVMDRMFFVNETTLYVSSLGYGWLSSGTTDPLLADAAVIASRMAALLWISLVDWYGWSPETILALESYR